MAPCSNFCHMWGEKSEISMLPWLYLYQRLQGLTWSLQWFPVLTVGISCLGGASLCPVFVMSFLLSQIPLCLSPCSIPIIGFKVHLTNPGWCCHLKIITFPKFLGIRVWTVFMAGFQCTCAKLWDLPRHSKPFWRNRKIKGPSTRWSHQVEKRLTVGSSRFVGRT